MASCKSLWFALLLICCFLVSSDGLQEDSDDDWLQDDQEDALESERRLKRMIDLVTPLMGIFHQFSGKRSVRDVATTAVGEARANRDSYSSYGEYDSGSSYGYGGGGGGYGGGCCNKKDELLPILALVALSLLLLYLITLATTTTSSTGKRKRSLDQDNDIELLDAPAWLSMVQDLWEHDAEMADKSLSCAQRTLCRMNRVARSSPTKASWAVSISSVPLSYLLHHRHQGGFTNYLDASLMGMSGANCSMIYSECPRLL